MIISFIKCLVSFCVICFPVTAAIMLFSLKGLGLDPVGSHVKSKWSVDIDMKFFSNLRKGYAISKGSKVVPTLNLLIFYGGLIGIVFFPLVMTVIVYW